MGRKVSEWKFSVIADSYVKWDLQIYIATNFTKMNERKYSIINIYSLFPLRKNYMSMTGDSTLLLLD